MSTTYTFKILLDKKFSAFTYTSFINFLYTSFSLIK